jgi:AcrR family transcriptional regulator
MENNDPRFVRSRLKLREAILRLAAEDPEKITISRVCELTGVDRATYYRHFSDLDGLIADTIGSQIDEAADQWLALADGSGTQSDLSLELMTEFLQHIVEHWKLFRWAVWRQNSHQTVVAILRRLTAGTVLEMRALDPGRSELAIVREAAYHGGATLGVLLDWLEAEHPTVAPADLARWLNAATNTHSLAALDPLAEPRTPSAL